MGALTLAGYMVAFSAFMNGKVSVVVATRWRGPSAIGERDVGTVPSVVYRTSTREREDTTCAFAAPPPGCNLRDRPVNFRLRLAQAPLMRLSLPAMNTAQAFYSYFIIRHRLVG